MLVCEPQWFLSLSANSKALHSRSIRDTATPAQQAEHNITGFQIQLLLSEVRLSRGLNPIFKMLMSARVQFSRILTCARTIVSVAIPSSSLKMARNIYHMRS